MSKGSTPFLLTLHQLNERRMSTGFLPDTGGDCDLSQSAVRLSGGHFLLFVLVSSVCLPPDIILFFFSVLPLEIYGAWKLSLHIAVSVFLEEKKKNRCSLSRGLLSY